MEIPELHRLFKKHPIINIDSRSIEKDCLFVALKGENHDANKFARQALEKGAAYAVVDNSSVVENDKYILVNNSLETLQQLALHHRKQFNLPVIAITGSNGKTTTKELIAKALEKKYKCLYTKGNLNNHIGLPLTLLKLNETHQIAVVEMGANHIGEIDRLCQIALPNFGLITNIGHAHLEGFGSYEGVVTAKTELYRFMSRQLGKIFINTDDGLLIKHAEDISCVTYGSASTANYRAEIKNHHPFLTLHCTENSTNYELKSSLTGSYNFSNIMAAVCIARYFGVRVDDLKDAIFSYSPDNNRSQILNTGKNHIILDAYNANPSSMMVAIENFKNYPADKKMCIFGDMLELGAYATEEHCKIRDRALNSGFEKIIFVGSNFMEVKTDKSGATFVAGTQEAKKMLEKQVVSGYTILIKGSRKIQLELLAEIL